MRIEDMTPEMIEQAKKCETAEERMAFIEENGIEHQSEWKRPFVSEFDWLVRPACSL